MEQLQVLSVCVIVKHLFNKQETKGKSSNTLLAWMQSINTHHELCVCVYMRVFPSSSSGGGGMRL